MKKPGLLRHVFSHLYNLESQKNASVAERVVHSNGSIGLNWPWRQELSSFKEVNDLIVCLGLLFGISLHNSHDVWVWIWMADKSKSYKAESMRKLFSGCRFHDSVPGFVWNWWVPLKVNVFGWRLFLNRLPTKEGLRLRYFQLDSPLCPFCEEVDESADHIFTTCHYSIEVWSAVASWCHLQPIFTFSTRDLLNLHSFLQLSKIKKRVIQFITLNPIKVLWKSRNTIIFNHARRSQAHVFNEIKSIGFIWLSNRAKIVSLVADSWNRLWACFESFCT